MTAILSIKDPEELYQPGLSVGQGAWRRVRPRGNGLHDHEWRQLEEK